ncbi:hypothetical protein GCM10009804_69680 [Kribbella hippodromi]|uniref:Uncharacterized protein n=1 Tax=Kribbella hippodromi TaxID=434347 RepID=A0ABP4QD87_9ACTN
MRTFSTFVSARWYIGTESAGVGFTTGVGVDAALEDGVLEDGVLEGGALVGVPPPAAAASSPFGPLLQPANASTPTPTMTTNERIPGHPQM